jgi:hypothetical protein
MCVRAKWHVPTNGDVAVIVVMGGVASSAVDRLFGYGPVQHPATHTTHNIVCSTLIREGRGDSLSDLVFFPRNARNIRNSQWRMGVHMPYR